MLRDSPAAGARRLGATAAGLALALTQVGCPTARTFVEDFTFPSSPPAAPPPPAYDLTLAATVVPSIAVGYHEPRAAGACLRDVLLAGSQPSPRERMTTLWSFGNCVSQKPLDEKGALASCAAIHFKSLPKVSASDGGSVSLACALSDGDKALVLGALADAGQGLFGYHRALRPDQRSFGDAGDPGGAIHDAMIKSVDSAVRLLERDPEHASKDGPARAELPMVAMSGGAAGGAFTAGYVHALLSAREEAIAARQKANDAAAVERIRTRERFGAATGASVGALVAQILDLYFSDASANHAAPLPPALRQDLEACLGAGPIKDAGDRLAQACALELLRHEFTWHSEWHHLCVEDAGIKDLLGDKASNLMRFDPMHQRVIDPFFRKFDRLVMENDFLHVVTAVDLQQNVVFALDERACAPLSGNKRHECLENAVLASIVEPVFAAGVDKVYSGLRGDEGERGQWYDGGLRSGTPALRALQLTDWPLTREPITKGGGPFLPLRVLTINTNRAEGTPSNVAHGVFPVLFGMIGSFVGQGRAWEQAFVAPYAELRRNSLCELAPAACASSARAMVSLPAPSLVTRAGLLTAVFAPEKLEPSGASTDNYQFDPLMMLGLFLLGERTFLESDPRELLGTLGWTTVREHLDNARLDAWKKDASARVTEYNARFADQAFRQKYRDKRKSTFDDCMKTCGDDLRVSAACDVDPLAPWDLAKLRPARPKAAP
jgi:hypothetical protein